MSKIQPLKIQPLESSIFLETFFVKGIYNETILLHWSSPSKNSVTAQSNMSVNFFCKDRLSRIFEKFIYRPAFFSVVQFHSTEDFFMNEYGKYGYAQFGRKKFASNKITILSKVLGVKLPDKCKQAIFLAGRVESIKMIYYKLGQFWEMNILVSKLLSQMTPNSRNWPKRHFFIYES